MKNIKDLKVITKEGLSVKNLQRFPSMEWGEEGGLEADLYFNGELAANIFNEGCGGCASVSWKIETPEFKKACFDFLCRVDSSYGPNSEYEWLRGKTADKIDDDDLESVVINIEARYSDIQAAKKIIKQGFKAAAAVKSARLIKYLSLKTDNITKENIKYYLQVKGLDKEYSEIYILTEKTMKEAY